MEFIYINSMLAFTLAFFFTCILIPIFIAIANRFSVLDYPNGSTKNHKRPTPYLGGVAIFFGFLIPLALILPFDIHIVYVVSGCFFLIILGLADDIQPLQPWQKLIGQLAAVLYFITCGFYFEFGRLDLLSMLCSGLWMLTLINAFNLIDIMDGLATTVALWCSCGFFIAALLMHQYTLALLLATLVGSLIAFLMFNAPPARIYLGDAGALFLGGVMGCVPFLLDWDFARHTYLASVAILAIPILEIFGLIIIRSYKKIPFYLASPDHFAIYLQKKGESIQRILCFISVASWIAIGCALFFIQGTFGVPELILLGLCYIAFWLYCIF